MKMYRLKVHTENGRVCQMKRIFHPYEKWEEIDMWRIIGTEEREKYATKSSNLMKNLNRFKSAMQKVLIEWPISCECNLSAKTMNRRAWLGHAGCYIELGSPEEATRLGWHKLTQYEQNEANRIADEVILEWEAQYAEKIS